MPLLKLVPLNELDIIVNKLNQEKYYHSYLNEFGDSKEVIDEFGNIISILNYFYNDVNLIKDSLQKSFEHDYERKFALKSIIDKLVEDSAEILINAEIKETQKGFWDYINGIMVDFYDKKSGMSDIKFYQENFVEPLKKGLLPYAQTVPVAHHLIVQTKNASVLHFDIISHNLKVADDFEDTYKKMNNNMEKFRKAIKRLTDYKSS